MSEVRAVEESSLKVKIERVWLQTRFVHIVVESLIPIDVNRRARRIAEMMRVVAVDEPPNAFGMSQGLIQEVVTL